MADPRQAGNHPSNRMCQMCNARAPSFYCMCTGSQFFVCAGCIEQHYNKTPNLPHVLMPVQMEIDGFNAYQQRVRNFGAGKAELEANLTKIDQCCQELTETVNSLITSLAQYRDYWVGQLQVWKDTLAGDINQAVTEVQAFLGDEQVNLTGKYSMFLREYQPGNLVLFNYRIDPSSIASSLESLFKTEYPQPKKLPSNPAPTQAAKAASLQQTPKVQPLSSPQNVEKRSILLPRLKDQQVSMFDFRSNTWGPARRLNEQIKADDYTAYAMLDADRLFCCGNNHSSSKEAYVVHVESARVETLPLMNHPRVYPGVLVFREEIFVFGGIITKPSVEVFASRSWTLLPSTMSCLRLNFTPCEYVGKAYLFHSSYPACIDVLDLVTRSFLTPISVQLEKGDTGTVSVVVGEELTIISGSYTAKLNLRTGGSPQVTKHSKADLYPRSSAVVVGEWVYWVHYNGQAMRGGASVEVLS